MYQKKLALFEHFTPGTIEISENKILKILKFNPKSKYFQFALNGRDDDHPRHIFARI